MPIKIIHTADFHIGMENYGFIDPKTGQHTRLSDFQRSISYIIDYAIEKNVDCFVFAGDAYKNHHPTPTHQKILLTAFNKLLFAKIPLIMVVGNHDHSGSSFKTNALDIFNHIQSKWCFVFSKIGAKIIETKNGPLQIVGVPWPSKSLFSFQESEALNKEDMATIIQKKIAAHISWYGAKLNPKIPSLLVGHFTIKDAIFSGSERTTVVGRDPLFFADDLSPHYFDYIALGHLHAHQYFTKNHNTTIVYPGSPDYIDFGEQKNEKGFVEAIIEKGNSTFTFIKNPVVRPLKEIIFPQNIGENFETECRSIIEKENIDGAIVKIKYFAEGSTTNTSMDDFFHILCKDAWCITDIQKIIPEKISKKKLDAPVINENKEIGEMIRDYCEKKSELFPHIKTYLEIIDEHSQTVSTTHG